MSQEKTGIKDSASPPSEEPDEKKKGGCLTPGFVLTTVVIGMGLAALLVPNFIRARSQGSMTACKSNLKNIGTAFEMYSTDWSGKYPTALSKLTPNYLKTIPECPPAGKVTYTIQTGVNAAYNSTGFEDYYFIQCEGPNHTTISVPENYPQYDGVQGLIDR
jgi:type II secretory pathway pseudopilin PulG